MKCLNAFVSLAILLVASTILPAAEIKENQTDVLFSGTIRANYPGRNTAMKGLVIKLGEDEQTFVCYDTDLMRLSLAWTGKFLKFGNYQREIVHPQPPEVAGTSLFGTGRSSMSKIGLPVTRFSVNIRPVLFTMMTAGTVAPSRTRSTRSGADWVS